MADNHDDAAIVRSTVDLAESLGIRTVAEGVETEYTRQLLADAGCTLVQGWLTAYPMPADELSGWIEANHPGATAITAAAPGLASPDGPPTGRPDENRDETYAGSQH